MHELAMVSSILQVINDQIREHGVNRVIQVKLVAGELTGVEDMTMQACFETLTEATPLEGVQLIIERVPVKVRCRTCGNEFIARNMSFKCAECGNRNIKFIGGNELYIESMEVE